MTTTTAIATTATLSDLALAEAEIENVITDWFMNAYDPERRDAAGGFEHLTGLMVERGRDLIDDAAAEGFVRVSRGLSVIEVTSIDVDLAQGSGVASSCSGSDLIRLDIETREPTNDGDDPSFQYTSEWHVTLTNDGWKISEWYPSPNSTTVECEVSAAQ